MYDKQFRAEKKVHMAAEMTEYLLTAIVSDQQRAEGDWMCSLATQMEYSTAITR